MPDSHKPIMPEHIVIPPITLSPHTNLPPTTTAEEDLATALRRKINITWEYTQSLIAILIVSACVAAVFLLPIVDPLLANAFFLIVGFYFGRTNHTRNPTP